MHQHNNNPHTNAHPQPGAAAHGHAQPAAPQTEGRLIHNALLYDPLVWLMSLGWTRELRATPLDLAALQAGEHVLDVGCGTGELTRAAARRVGPRGTVYGIDASPEMIATARHKARRTARDACAVQFQLAAVEALSFADASFDVVLSSMMMHHLPGDLRRRGLVEIRRVLRPGGRLVIVDWDWQPGSKTPRLWQPGGLAAHRHGSHAPAAPAPNVLTGMAALVFLLREAGFVDVKQGSLRYDWLGYATARLPQ